MTGKAVPLWKHSEKVDLQREKRGKVLQALFAQSGGTLTPVTPQQGTEGTRQSPLDSGVSMQQKGLCGSHKVQCSDQRERSREGLMMSLLPTPSPYPVKITEPLPLAVTDFTIFLKICLSH